MTEEVRGVQMANDNEEVDVVVERQSSENDSSCQEPVDVYKPDHCESQSNTALVARRSSSLGVSLMTEYSCSQTTEVQSAGYPSLCSQPTKSEASPMPPYRPMVGAGAAAAFEALRHDFYVQKNKEKQRRRMSSLSLGSAKANVNVGPSNPQEQYEMLKLHHLNLMNEVQETALMLNLYEQQLLVRQQKEHIQRMAQAALQHQTDTKKRSCGDSASENIAKRQKTAV